MLFYYEMSLGLISAPNISAMDISAQTFRLLGRFGTCTFRHRGHFDTWTLRHRAISAQGHFGRGDISAHGCFGTLDVSAHGHFGTADISACGHFGAVDVSARGHFGTVDISARGFFDTGLFGTGFFSTFQVRNFLMWTFRHVDISAWWTFRHRDFSALDVSARVFWAHFSLGIFRADISASGRFGMVDISARGFFGTGHFGTGFFGAHFSWGFFWRGHLCPTIPSQVKVMQGCFFLSSPLHIIIISQALWRLSQNQPLQLDLISFWAGIWTSGKFRGAFGPIIQYFLSLHWTVSPRFFVHHKIRPDYWFE